MFKAEAKMPQLLSTRIAKPAAGSIAVTASGDNEITDSTESTDGLPNSPVSQYSARLSDGEESKEELPKSNDPVAPKCGASTGSRNPPQFNNKMPVDTVLFI